MKHIKWMFFLWIVVIITGCNYQNLEQQPSNYGTYSNDRTILHNQQDAIKAENEVLKFDEVTNVVAVNTEDKILLGFKVKQFEKFRLEKVEKKVKDKLKETFPNHEITAESDLKVFIETERMKNKLTDESYKKDKLEKDMDKIIKLSREQT